VAVGGTGLYLKALIDGLSPIPDIPEAVRLEARRLFHSLGNQAFHDQLTRRDPLTAGRLAPGNSQRLMRAWEVLEATGRPLADWQDEPPRNRLDADVLAIALLPPTSQLYPACDRRFLAMLGQGAMDEARAFMALGLDACLPVAKVLGLAALSDHLAGTASLELAVARAQQATRNYAKRQRTWFRHQLAARIVVDAQHSESFLPQIFAIIRQFMLTGGGCESRLPASRANLGGKDQTS
ncbi:MAG TPA: tRNA (adenosine(37)-N6)-dimethylallyltransferase MiaA, partial [Rhodospirillaceae bacterium]|nr:tRNA (adenosine(37)-N6)-dimethylallyltransferase MiaA [Rhodospirillaceae bacterium]